MPASQVYGRGPFTLAGFPPWQVRSAEVLSMGPLSEATQPGLTAALQRYVGTKQRFGK